MKTTEMKKKKNTKKCRRPDEEIYTNVKALQCLLNAYSFQYFRTDTTDQRHYHTLKHLCITSGHTGCRGIHRRSYRAQWYAHLVTAHQTDLLQNMKTTIDRLAVMHLLPTTIPCFVHRTVCIYI